MKTLKIMLIIVASIFAILFFLNIFYPWQYYPTPESDAPLPDLRTKREKRFCDSLLHNGYSEVELRIQHLKDSKGSTYMPHWLFYKRDKPYDCMEVDSINYNNVQLLARLIKYYVEDSTIYYGEFLVHCKDVNDYNKSFKKWEQKSICGFEVVKIEKNKFKRIYNEAESSTKELFIPEQWKHSEFLCLPSN